MKKNIRNILWILFWVLIIISCIFIIFLIVFDKNIERTITTLSLLTPVWLIIQLIFITSESRIKVHFEFRETRQKELRDLISEYYSKAHAIICLPDDKYKENIKKLDKSYIKIIMIITELENTKLNGKLSEKSRVCKKEFNSLDFKENITKFHSKIRKNSKDKTLSKELEDLLLCFIELTHCKIEETKLLF